MTLRTQAQCLNALNELECTEWIESTSQITEDLNSDADRKGDGAEGLPEFEAVVTWCWLNHLGESLGVLAPVEFA